MRYILLERTIQWNFLCKFSKLNDKLKRRTLQVFRKRLTGRTRTRQSCPDFRCPCPPTSGWNCYILYVTYILLGKHPIFTVGEKNLTKKPTILQGRMGLSGSNEYKNVILYIFALVKYANQLIILASTCPIHLSQWSKIHKII